MFQPATVQIDGIQLHYIQQGKGPAVIFVHGALGDYCSWQFQIEPFSRKYRAISYSRRFAYPNVSTGDARKDNTIEGSASDLARLRRKLDLAPAFVVGHSSGAFLAFADYQDICSGIVSPYRGP
jgi:non-heme chloroperoxidase